MGKIYDLIKEQETKPSQELEKKLAYEVCALIDGIIDLKDYLEYTKTPISKEYIISALREIIINKD